LLSISIIIIFINDVVNGKPPVVYDDGTQTRCFTYIDDFIRGVITASSTKAGENEVFNLGSTRETSIRDLANMVLDIADANIKPEYVDTFELYGDSYEDLEQRVPNVSKANEILGWEANTALNSGIRRTLEWWRKYYSE
jgi:UDP-glucose 4-epimerase